MKGEEFIESISGVPPKDLLKVKSMTKWSTITPKVWELGNSTYLGEEEA